MHRTAIDCRDLLGMAIAKRAAGRNWRQIRDDLLFYVRGRGIELQVQGQDEEYEFHFPGGRVFFRRANGEYGYQGTTRVDTAQLP